MYRSYSLSRFLWLLHADAVVFALCGAFFFVGRFLFTSAPEHLQERVSHSLGRAGGLEELSHHYAETDDDSDAPERSAETVRD